MNKPDNTAPNEKPLRTRLYYGRPLTSKAKWVGFKILYVLFCAIGVVAVLMFTEGIVQAVGLTIMAFFVGGLFEVFTMRYDNYRREWELVNRNDSRDVDALG
ncbi:MAG: hypothetical protein M3335_02745 [Actinomycetota bacterium]|nr:hypothetical protein [Actinomycetota bacterium]